jgi:hypothetical protein
LPAAWSPPSPLPCLYFAIPDWLLLSGCAV